MDTPEQFLATELAKAGVLTRDPQHVELEKALGDLASRLPRQGSKSLSFSKSFEVPVKADKALLGVLALLGRRADEVFRVEGDSKLPGLFAFVPSGWLNLNMTAVLVYVTAVQPAACTLLVSAIAREGLISQSAAKKTVLRLEGELGRMVA